MSIDLPAATEEQLKDLAKRQGREVGAVVEDALRLYLEAAAITDLEPGEIAAAQATLIPELPPVAGWEADDV